MDHVLTVKQMQQKDKYTIETLGIPQEELVQRAGGAVAEEIIKRFSGGRVLVCIGKGNNGADGRVVFDIISKTKGFSAKLIEVFEGDFSAFNDKFDIIADCMFGTGLNRAVSGEYKKAIELINDSGAFVVSCDIASGINGDNGRVMGASVKANLTVAIQNYKLGHFLNDGIDFSGEIVVRDIGIRAENENAVNKIDLNTAKKYFNSEKRNVHKGSFGKCAIIGGSRDYSGSVVLSANALCSFKMGTGYVNLSVPKSMFSSYVGKVPEVILNFIKDRKGKMICDKKSLKKLLSYDAIAVGMGIGVSRGGYKLIKYLIENYQGKLLIDADGINCISAYNKQIFAKKRCQIVLTPHVKEFERLCGISKEEILSNPIEIVSDFVRHNDVCVLLKGATSIIIGQNDGYINTYGCSGMAKGGSGDVLSGIAVGLLARSDNVCEAVAVASCLFGRAGEIARKEQNNFTMTPSDTISALPKVINEFF